MSLFNKVTKTFQWGQHTVTLETGEIARAHIPTLAAFNDFDSAQKIGYFVDFLQRTGIGRNEQNRRGDFLGN